MDFRTERLSIDRGEKSIILNFDLSIDKKSVRKASVYGLPDGEVVYRQRRKKYKILEKNDWI